MLTCVPTHSIYMFIRISVALDELKREYTKRVRISNMLGW
jgi:hypothetical protein